jgi:hypothetical protein
MGDGHVRRTRAEEGALLPMAGLGDETADVVSRVVAEGYAAPADHDW